MKVKLDKDDLLPYRDRLLRDRPGEVWKAVPGYEDYLMISNQGRVKKNELGINGDFAKREMIILPCINSSYNSYIDEIRKTLQLGCMINGKRIYFQIHRMVYYCYVEKFDLNNKDILIGIMGNRLEITPDKLFLTNNRGKVHEMYELGRQHSLISEDVQGLDALKQEQSGQLKCVSQYSVDGRLLNTFDNITQASDNTGVSIRWIRYSAKWLVCLSKGFYWRYGAEATVDVQIIKEIMAMEEIHTIADAYDYYKKVAS